jgi:phthalate 4,5-dioxygenase reductase subunit
MPASEVKTEHVYDVHVFCCINERAQDHPRSSCAARGSVDLQKHMKDRAKELKIKNIRINKAGCLERCELGPVLVIYPEATWYRYDTTDDIDDILSQHIIGRQRVERLILKNDQKVPAPTIKSRIKLRVGGIKKLTRNVKKFEFFPEIEGLLPTFTAGSHINIITPNGHRRSYSLANSPKQRQYYEIAVLRESDGGGGSAWMHDTLALGDSVEASLPTNNFPLDKSAEHHLLIAGGIGIVPLLSMGRALHEKGASATLHYCARGPESTPYAKEAKEVFADQVHFHHDGGNPENGIDLQQILATPTENTCIYVCGPSGLITAVQNAASHWPEGMVRFEKFVSDRQEPLHQNNDTAFDIVLSRQRKTLSVPPGKSILDVVNDAGINVSSSCEDGVCGSCQVRLLGGKAEHRDSFLKEKDHQNAIMICTSRAEKGETLILDI